MFTLVFVWAYLRYHALYGILIIVQLEHLLCYYFVVVNFIVMLVFYQHYHAESSVNIIHLPPIKPQLHNQALLLLLAGMFKSPPFTNYPPFN